MGKQNKKQFFVVVVFVPSEEEDGRRPNTECFRSLNSIRVPLLSRVQVL